MVKCRDCGAPYGKDGWVDVSIPDEIWNIVCPEDGVLCFRCMTKRIEALGVRDVPVTVSSGPYKDANEEWRQVGWNHGYKVGCAALEAERDRLKECVSDFLSIYYERDVLCQDGSGHVDRCRCRKCVQNRARRALKEE